MNERKELALFPFYYVLSILYKFPIKQNSTFKLLIRYQRDEMNNKLYSKKTTILYGISKDSLCHRGCM